MSLNFTEILENKIGTLNTNYVFAGAVFVALAGAGFAFTGNEVSPCKDFFNSATGSDHIEKIRTATQPNKLTSVTIEIAGGHTCTYQVPKI